MSRVRYTASGRLGVWDSVDKPGMDNWRSRFEELLKSNAHGVIESDVHDLTETDDPALAAITAVCDKIIARGNPTLVDPNWERMLLTGPGREFLRWEEPTDPEVKFCVKEFLLQEAVENLVMEIGSLVELSGRVIDALNASEIRGLVTEMRTILSRRMDGLRTELLENTKSSTERVGAELQTALIQHMDSLGRDIAAGTESATGRVGAELRGALIQRMDILEKKIAAGTESATGRVGAELRGALIQRMDILEKKIAAGIESATEQAGAELRGALVQRVDSLEKEITAGTESAAKLVSAEIVTTSEKRMTDNDEMMKRLDALGSHVAEMRELVEKSSKRKGLFL